MKKQFMFLLCIIFALTLVSAIHDATIAVSPSGWLRTSTNYEFTFTITNNDATAGISQVMIMRPSSFSNLLCQDTAGWVTTPTTTSCTWEATSSNKINQGQSKQFKINIITTSNYGEHNWSIFTKEIFASTAEDIITTELQTIQSKINSANSGDTIAIPAGTYDEDTTIILNKSITLQGASNTQTIINFAQNKDGFIITKDNVTLKDLKITTGSSGAAPILAVSIKETAGVKINNLIIETTGNKSMGIWVGGSNNGLQPSTNLKITNNKITINDEATGIYADHSTPAHSKWLIQSNTIIAYVNPIELYDVSNSEANSNQITITGSDGSSVIWSAELSNIYNLTFINNIINKSGGSQVAFLTDFIPAETTIDTLSTNITITNNTFTNWGSRALRIGVNVSNVKAHNNLLLKGSQTQTIKNEDSSSVNATFNYWGTQILSEIQALISGNVDFDPWWYDTQGSADITAPLASFLNTPYTNITNGSITITANMSDNRALDNYFLDFGNGQNISGNFTGNHNLSETITITHQYLTTGETTFTITLTIKDKTGNTKTLTTSAVVNSVTPDWIIELKKSKMNMFSIPLTPNDTYYQTVLSNIKCNMDKIWSYQNSSWIYKTVSSSCGWSSGNLQDIKPGYGYIIFMKEDDVLYGNGKQLSVETPPEVTLTTGWNLIGHYGTITNLTTAQTLSSLELGNNYYWNSLLKVNDNGQLESTNNPQPTKAYWISIKGLDLDAGQTKYFKYMPSQQAY